MIFPNLALWSSRDPDDAAARIDRALNDRNHRLCAGISISKPFRKISGALVLCQGNGKYIRVRHVVHEETEIPAAIRDSLIELTSGNELDLGRCAPVLSDLAEVQAATVERLKCEAGKYVDRVLAISVKDPGFWTTDFDGKRSYSSMCDAMRLAEISGVSVIDSFPARDLAVGGTGKRLEALPYWLLFADRDQPVAKHKRSLISVGDQTTGFLLPPSDGLDADLPQIHSFETVGVSFLNQLTGKYLPKSINRPEIDLLYADGQDLPQLRQAWSNVVAETRLNFSEVKNYGTSDGWQAYSVVQGHLVQVASEWMEKEGETLSSLIRSGVQWLADQMLENLDQLEQSAAQQVMLACSAQYEAGLVSQFERARSSYEVVPTRQLGFHREDLSAVVAALMGLFHIDQLPANVPWLTGAESQRILGRLTPGRPASWRNLIRAMSDFHPAPMKLKDAV